MEPRPHAPVDTNAFAKLRRIAPGVLAAERAARHGDAPPTAAVPEELALKLTNRCDLRCTHCYQWGETGYHHSLDGEALTGDLALSIIEGLLDATAANKANLYLWGGEPLVYRQWDDLMDLLATDQRWTSICTNGTMLERRLASLAPISDQVELVVSIDGLESEHDKLRGAGAFRRTMSGVRAVGVARTTGEFRGEISVNCVIGDSLVGKVFDLVASLERAGIDTVYLSLPWYLAPDAAADMDRYVAQHAPWTFATATGVGPPSWHSYTFGLDPAHLDALRADLDRTRRQEWQLKVRFNPELGDDELEPFVRGSAVPAQGRTRCQSLGTRLDVFPDGRVVSCKFFPESVVGDLQRHDLDTVWHGRRFERVRRTIDEHGLMPGCAKCPLLYSRGG